MPRFVMVFAAAVLTAALSWAAAAQDQRVGGDDTAASSWSGLYVGGTIGYSWGQTGNPNAALQNDPVICGGGFILLDCLFALGIAPGGSQYQSVGYHGVAGGGQVGFDWQSGPWVVGGVAELLGTDISGSRSASTPAAPGTQIGAFNDVKPATFNPGFSVDQRLTAAVSMLTTIRARAGFAVNNWLLYGTGGLAIGDIRSTVSLSRPGFSIFLFPLSLAGSHEATKPGWAAGAGVEYGVDGRWSMGIEYLRFDLGRLTVTGTAADALSVLAPPATVSANQRFSGNIAKAMIHYRF